MSTEWKIFWILVAIAFGGLIMEKALIPTIMWFLEKWDNFWEKVKAIVTNPVWLVLLIGGSLVMAFIESGPGLRIFLSIGIPIVIIAVAIFILRNPE